MMTRALQTLGVFGLLSAGLLIAGAESAQAQYRYGNGYNNSYYGGSSCYNPIVRRSGPIYHPPSVHYDRVYHADYLHWTPRRGLHTHGHTHVVPHYTPGHYDYLHGNHVHPNRNFHHNRRY